MNKILIIIIILYLYINYILYIHRVYNTYIEKVQFLSHRAVKPANTPKGAIVNILDYIGSGYTYFCEMGLNCGAWEQKGLENLCFNHTTPEWV